MPQTASRKPVSFLGLKFNMPSTFAQVIIGLVAGMIFGLFFGEDILVIEDVGTAYIRLLQMSVLPYILVSLTGSIGKLLPGHARRIGRAGGLLILSIWTITMITVSMLPLAYPDWEAATFFSTSIIAEASSFDPVTLYLPANPFNAMANTIVPAVVVFSLAMGIALIGVPNKDNLIVALDNISRALSRITSAVVKAAPIGVFAITAVAFGTLDFEQLNKLQIYLWIYITAWAILTFWTLPVLLSGSTALKYSEVLRQSRLPVITAIAVGSVLVVLPLIAERCKALLEQHKLHNDETDATIDVLVPTAYSFPSAGTLLGLGFLLFAAWFAGSPLSLSQLPEFNITGLMTAFGSMNVALPFLLTQFHLSSDLFQLFLLTSPVTGRLATGLAAMHAVTVSLMGAYAICGQFSWHRFLRIAAISLAATFVLLFSLSFVLTNLIPFKYAGYERFINIELLTEPVKTIPVESQNPLSNDQQNLDRLSIILQRGVIRVGYVEGRLPFVYRNKAGNVVGFEMELVNALANDLGVTIELTRIKATQDIDEGEKWLNTGKLDLVIGGLNLTPPNVLKYNFSRSYLEGHIGLITPDYKREAFANLDSIREMPNLKLALLDIPYLKKVISEIFPDAELVTVKSIRPFMRGQTPDIDAFINNAESGSAWSIIYPDHTVVIPKNMKVTIPIALALPLDQEHFSKKLDDWLTLMESNNTVNEFYEHWILGKSKKAKEPRWSIIRNVLHWVD